MARTNADTLWRETERNIGFFGRNPFDLKGWREDRKIMNRGFELCDDCTESFRAYCLATTRKFNQERVWSVLAFAAFFLAVLAYWLIHLHLR